MSKSARSSQQGFYGRVFPVLSGVVLAGSLMVTLPQPVVAQQEINTQEERERARQRLEQLQRNIDQRRAAIEATQSQLSDIEQQLRAVEQRINQVSQRIQNTERQLAANQSRIAELETEQAELRASLQQQASLLADQIESAYRAGGNDFLQLLLNQQSPARIERIITYYKYFNEQRMEQLQALHATEAQLLEVGEQLTVQRDELEQAIARQERQRGQLESEQTEQQQARQSLVRQQRNDESELTNLLQNEQELTELLAVLDDVIQQQDVQLAGLANQRGRLNWPVDGRVMHRFGQRRSSQVNWKGVMFSTSAEEPVQSIADGQVLFADWLKGFGLVIVLDHGEGYMSLYAHNQALMRDVGESVRRGDTIALTGQSGGLDSPGLYFEIRHQGNPINPTQFVR